MAHPSADARSGTPSDCTGGNYRAVRNTGYPVPAVAIEKSDRGRASKVPGGWCGFYGDCGAAVGNPGMAVSVLTNAKPLTGKGPVISTGATSFGFYHVCWTATALLQAGHQERPSMRRLIIERLNLGIRLGKIKRGFLHLHSQESAVRESGCPYYPQKK